MRFLSLIALTIVLSLTSALAQSEQDSVYKIEREVEVEDEREATDRGYEYISTQNLDEALINNLDPNEVSDIVKYASGVSIRSYGGLSSMKTISLRGLPSNQSLILLDGMRITGTQNGLADLSKIPANAIGRVEVAKGGLSARYGSNAIAGVVNLITKTELQDKYKVEGSYDNFTNKIYTVEATKNIDSVPVSAVVRHIDSDGLYTFERKGKSFERENSQVKDTDISLFSAIDLGDVFFKPVILIKDSRRGVPQSVLDTTQLSNRPFLDEQDIATIFNFDIRNLENTKLNLGLAYNYNQMHYKDSTKLEFGENGLDNRYFNNSIQFKSNYERRINNFIITGLTDLSYMTLRGDMLQEVDDMPIKRTNFGFALSLDHVWDFEDFEYSLYGSTRYDLTSDMGEEFSPMIGNSFKLKNIDAEAAFSYSQNFRVPSFNEMYYLNYGNQDLLPEHSKTLNLSLKYSPFQWIRLSTSLYRTNTKDQIASVPKSVITWQAQNVDEVNTEGIEFSVSSKPIENLEIIYNYTYQNPLMKSGDANLDGKLLVYTPKEIISGMATYLFEEMNFGLGISFQRMSYTYPTMDNQIELIIPAHNLFDFYVFYKPKLFKGNLNLRLDLKNAFDEQYEIIRNYPMPGRNIKATVGYEI